MKVKFKKLHDMAKIPTYANTNDSGADIYANVILTCGSECVGIEAHSYLLIKTGIAMELPEGYEAQVRSRSGLAAKYGLQAHFGTIDCVTKDTKILIDNNEVMLQDILDNPEIYNKVISYNEEEEIFENKEIKDIWLVGKKEVFEIELEDGSKLKCTENQKILTDKGWKLLRDINIFDDLVMTCN